MVSLWKDARNGVRVVRLTTPKEIETLIRLFEEVAETEGWQPEGAIRLFRERSVFFALEVRGDIAGGLQMVQPDRLGTLPCQVLWPEVEIAPSDRCAHVAMLALAPDFRGRRSLFWPLVIEMWRYGVGENIATLFLEVTPRVMPLYRRLGWPLTVRGELRRHWGEDCYLCSLGLAEAAQTFLTRAENSASYRRIVAQAFRVRLSAGKARRKAANKETGSNAPTLAG